MRHAAVLQEKEKFISDLRAFAVTLSDYVSEKNNQWSIKGFIDSNKNIYTISSDTKVISKIIEIQIFPKIMEFAEISGYEIILAEHQNWYPDLSFVKKTDRSIKFAVDIKTSYRLDKESGFCNGFTLGSHGTYFRDRNSTKNIQFPYKDYLSHIVLGVLYTRMPHKSTNETEIYRPENLDAINSVISDLMFFVQEKWRIASDRSGSGNTANIGSIKNILDIIQGKGVFAKFGEDIFDEFWINQGVLCVPDKNNRGNYKTLTKVEEYLDFKRFQGSRWK